MIDWVGTYEYAIGDTGSGASGTITVPKGAQLRSVTCHATGAGATLTIGSGPAIPIPAGVGFTFPYDPGMLVAGKGILATPTIVTSGTDSLAADYFKAPS